MSLPFRKFAAIISKVASPAFTRERLHGVLISKNPLLPTTGALEFTSYNDYKSKFGTSYASDVEFINRYFSVITAKGSAPQKLVVVRWANQDVAAFAFGANNPMSVSAIKSKTKGNITISLSGNSFDFELDPQSIDSYSSLATAIQGAIRGNSAGGTAFTNATVSYDATIGRFLIKNGNAGAESTIDKLEGKDENGKSLLAALGGFELNQGCAAESYVNALDRIYNLNTAGAFFVNYDSTLSSNDITGAIEWQQGTDNNQSRYSQVCVCILADGADERDVITGYIKGASLEESTGFWLIDKSTAPEAIGTRAATDYNLPDSVTNVNFSECKFGTPVTGYDNIIDYQNGKTNIVVAKAWDDAKFTYTYELGIGTQKTKLMGLGYEYGAFGTVMNQANEIALVRDIQMAWSNAAISLGNVYLHGASSEGLLSAIVQPCYTRAVANGTIARGPTTLTDEDKLKIMNIFGENGDNAVKSVENNGYYYYFWPRTTEDIANNQVRFAHAYQVGGSVNFLMGTSYIFK